MSAWQLGLGVVVPLAWPPVLAGIRTATVQTIGNAVVAALIGAGGLGTFIFQGLGQTAMDLVLLGTLPVVALALAADQILGFLSRPRGARP
jgi:osmoprotectant transport system permease protein